MRIKLVATPGKLTEEVRHQLNEMDNACFEGLYPKDGCYWWVAFGADGAPVGFAGLEVLTGDNKHVGFLCRAGVMPAGRGYGLQRRLIRTRIKAAGKLTLSRIVTYTHETNFVSCANLIRSGLHMYTSQSNYGGSDMLYFKTEL